MTPHRLTRSHKRWIGGVCGGIAEYFGWDADRVRIAYIIVLTITGILPMTIFYFIALFVIPENEK